MYGKFTPYLASYLAQYLRIHTVSLHISTLNSCLTQDGKPNSECKIMHLLLTGWVKGDKLATPNYTPRIKTRTTILLYCKVMIINNANCSNYPLVLARFNPELLKGETLPFQSSLNVPFSIASSRSCCFLKKSCVSSQTNQEELY